VRERGRSLTSNDVTRNWWNMPDSKGAPFVGHLRVASARPWNVRVAPNLLAEGVKHLNVVTAFATVIDPRA
jgi:hypothetical protein